MKLVDLLAKAHNKIQRDKVIRYVGNDRKRFAELIEVFFKGPYRITQRAAWPLSYCVEEHPTLIRPHLKKLLQYVTKSGQHDAVKRNSIRLLQYIEIPKSLQGLAADVCFRFLSDAKEPVAVKVFSMTVLTRLSQNEPELKNELIPIIEQQLPYSSPAFISRARRTLKELQK
jgi:hypothetical protein